MFVMIAFIILLAFLETASALMDNNRQYYFQPKLVSSQGHLSIVSAEDRNITIRTIGDGYININDENILEAISMAKKAAEKIKSFETGTFNQMKVKVDRLSVEQKVVFKELRYIGYKLANFSSTVVPRRSIGIRITRITRRVSTLEKLMKSFISLVGVDECSSNPCQNGGTCLDNFNSFHCQCPDEWEGKLCNRDVNECSRFSDTTFGCQNGGTCVNKPGTYECLCTPGWYGLHCKMNLYECTMESSRDLCGHGTCQTQGGTGKGFFCSCDPGWARDPKGGACTLDINECQSHILPCSHDPLVTCLNTPGSYHCASCPQGYLGNGYQCADIDECLVNNGGCSTEPPVQCINTRGSRVCGTCPLGFVGDGLYCSPAGGMCQVNNGGCYSAAICTENTGNVMCRCPLGWTGSGVGPNGCSPLGSSPCNTDPCLNGATCHLTSDNTTLCKCPPYFSGPRCETRWTDPCFPNPCLNNGQCKLTSGSGFQCLCPLGYIGITCEATIEGCVGDYTSLNGTLNWPGENSFDSRSSSAESCLWKIKSTNESLSINLNFNEFILGGSNPTNLCTERYVEVFDGPDTTENAKIGHYCEYSMPPSIIEATQSQVVVKLKAQGGERFQLNWNSVKPNCGGKINASSHGVIIYPKYGKYRNNFDCYWKFAAPYGKRIQFTFFSIKFKSDVNCTSDYIEFLNGRSLTSPVLQKYCSEEIPPPLVSESRYAILHFHSDENMNSDGFQLSYTQIGGYPGCGGVYTGASGTIKSPGQGSSYHGNVNCEWKIQLPLKEKIYAEFKSFNIERSSKHEICIYDYLEIYDGPNMNSGLVGKWCGDKLPTPVYSSSNVLTIFFHSDYTYNEGGFEIEYRAVCGGTYTDSQGIITSPYYPNHYPLDRMCEYRIIGPLGTVAEVKFLDLDIEITQDSPCIYDYLEIYDGTSNLAKQIGRYCGTSKPPTIISSHNQLYLRFKTDSSRTGKGFLANYTFIDVGCGGVLTDATGVISSPKYPLEYPPLQDCRWVIEAPPGFVVHITWQAFALEAATDCRHDRVIIYDSATENNTLTQNSLVYCGTHLPPAMTSVSNSIIIQFHSDGFGSEPGFTASYITLDAKRTCGGNYFSTMGVVSSPNYPEKYPNNINCAWIITVPHGQQIQLEIKDFNIEFHSRCKSDYLEIRNGGYEASPLIKRYCGTTIEQITSLSNQLYLKFVSDSALSEKGFQIKWNGASRGCGGTLTSAKGSIVSPNYPQPYGKNGECFYRISVSLGSKIQVTIVDIDLEDHMSCLLDYIELYDGINRKGPRLGRYCTSLHPVNIVSTTNHMYIRFRSDSSRQGRGFHLKYNTVCYQTLTGFQGVIESPNFPDTDPDISECLWTIAAPSGNSINISFSHFNIVNNPILQYFFQNKTKSCSESYLEISEESGINKPSNQLGKICGSSIPAKISSSLDHVYIHFAIGKYIHSSVFRLEWIVSGCGGVYIDKTFGKISSPGYPGAYHNKITCEWSITVPWGQSVQITVKDVSIEVGPNCAFDSLQVFGGGDDKSPLLGKLCQRLSEPSIFTTSGNKAFIRFETDHALNGRGFQAIFRAIPSQCGGKFVGLKGSVHSRNYPNNYEPHDDCQYLITSIQNHKINFTFQEFDIPLSENCSKSYVQIFDGSSPNSPSLLKHCGKTVPNSVLSSGNEIYIRQKADGIIASKGFIGHYIPTCGINIVTNGSGTIQYSEVLLLSINDGGNCSWTITSSNLESKIYLKFVFLDIAYKFEVFGNAIAIYAGEDTSAPLVNRITGMVSPPPITVPSSVATIVYEISHETDRIGRFTIDYSVMDTACGGMLSSESGIFISPNHPDNYPPNSECVWYIKASPGNKISLTFETFDLKESDFCNEDYVEIREEGPNGELLNLACSSTKPNNLTEYNSLWIKFRSGVLSSKTGFKAYYSLEHGSQLIGPSGQIASPLYPLRYTQSAYYGWRIEVERKKVIKIIFYDIFISTNIHNDGCDQGVQIFDGYDASAPLLFEACGYTPPDPHISSSNVVFVVFIVETSYDGSLFLLEWQEINKEVTKNEIISSENCTTYYMLSGDSKNISYEFHSPGYPNGYKQNLNCAWIFETIQQNHIYIDFLDINMDLSDMNLESAGKCTADYINIYSVVPGSPNQWDKLYTVCHSNSTLFEYHGGNIVKVELITDFFNNKTGFSAVAHSVCGGNINGPSGTLRTNITFGVNCKWNITVRQGRKINVNFESFPFTSIAAQTPCKHDYIMFRDGGSDDSPFLGDGKYCGSNPIIPMSTNNKLYVEVASLRHTMKEMILHYHEVPFKCGGQISLSKANNWTVISSPKYPNIPPAHIECVWRIMVPSGETVHFEVTDRFDMTPGFGCTIEYLELRNGATDLSPLIGRYCSTTPSYIVSERNALYVKYFTDINDPRDGFKAIVSMSKCGGTIYDSRSGTILSPGYPSAYESNMNCVWRLVAYEGYRFQLSFKTFNLGGRLTTSCDNKVDTLNITDIDRSNPINGSTSYIFCGKNASTVSLAGNEVLITFKSVAQPQFSVIRSFLIEYNTSLSDCGETFVLPTAVIKSPGYPVSKGKVYCYWKIIAPRGRKITFTVQDFDLEPIHTPILWSAQRIMFYDQGFSNRIVSWSGSKPAGTTVESSGSKMLIFYVSKLFSNHRGFIGTYTTDKPVDCGGELLGINGTVLVPKENENVSYICEWSRHSEPKNTLTIKISGSVNLRSTTECEFSRAKLIVYEGIESHVIGEFCSKTLPNKPFIVSSPFRTTTIKAFSGMYSEENVTNNVNFTMEWKVDECGDVFRSAPGTITSPNYPQPYSPNLDCAWQIIVPEGSTIQIKFNDFQVEKDCNKDYLIIHNGEFPSAPEMVKLCGNIISRDIISESNALWLHFHTDDKNQDQGFNISFSSESDVCGGIYHRSYSEIKTLNYPQQYKNNLECDWDLRVDRGFHIQLTFIERFFIEETSGCTNDFVEVSEEMDGKWNVIDRYCGRNLPSVITSKSNRVRVLFRSNEKVTGDGFKARWEAKCGGIIEGKQSGHIYSPRYPQHYVGPLDCNYTVIAPGEVISSRFNSFQLEQSISSECTYDNVRIYSSTGTKSNTLLGTYCGSFIPPNFTSKDKFTLHFTADSMTNFKGFDLYYDVSVCGGNITSDQVILSPTFRGRYLPNMNCVWNIIAKSTQIINIRFSKLRIAISRNCHSDHVAIWDTNNVTEQNSSEKLIAKLCGYFAINPPKYRTTGNTATIKFVTDELYNSEGFKALISFTTACRKMYEVPSLPGEVGILPPDVNGDGNYDSPLDCFWTLRAPALSNIRLTIPPLKLAPCKDNATSCSCGYLEVYNGISENDELIGHYCQTEKQITLISTDRFMSIKFATNEDHNGKLFKLTASAVASPCGPFELRVTEVPQTLVSPGYPNNYPNFLHCKWLLVGTTGAEIDIHFQDFDVEDSESCSADRLEIRDNLSTYFPFPPMWQSDDKVSIGRGQSNNLKQSLYVGTRKPTTTSKFCGQTHPIDFFAPGREQEIRFITNEINTAKGFKLSYSSGCSRNHTFPSGRIYKTALDQECTWLIKAPNENSTISIYFMDIAIFIRKGCSMAVLKVYDGPNKSSKLISSLCGFSSPNPIFSTGQYLLLEYSSEQKLKSVFDLTYVTTDKGRGCGGSIYNYGGVFSSPFYPGSYRNTSRCRWDITVPVGSVPYLLFRVFDIGPSSTCSTDFLEIYDLDHLELVLRDRYCGTAMPKLILGRTRTLVLIYTTSIHNAGEGWLAQFMAREPQDLI